MMSEQPGQQKIEEQEAASASQSETASKEQKQKRKQKQKNEKKKKVKEGEVDISSLETAAFIPARIKIFEELYAKQEEERKKKAEEKKPIKISLPDGHTAEGIAFETSPMDVAKSISKSLADRVVVALVDGQEWDATRPLEGDCSLELVDFESAKGKEVFWHSSSHVLGQAMERLYGCKLCTGPPLEEGFFYEAYMEDKAVSEGDYKTLEKIVSQVAKEKQPFQRLLIKKEDALELFKYNPFKYEILASKVPEGGYCTVYRCGNLIDPCRGPHLPHTGRVKAFSVTKNSSSYWKADANNETLQRVYAVSFPEKKQLDEYLEFQKMAKEKDHRKLGLDQELFFFHQLSPGSCFFFPKGAHIYNTLLDFMRKEYRKRGYTEVITPNLFNCQLWEISGHLKNYKENMFFIDVEKEQFALKPMNCPSHCLMFAQRVRSYRELPMRYADFGVLHRNEYSGALTGLTRVRRFQQDDAHIFCRPEDIMTEIVSVLQFLEHVYGVFGFEFHLELSTRPESYLGELAQWDEAESQLKSALEKFGKPWQLNPGDGAFYGPKIDITIEDALKRRHQCATVQLDFQLPIRFNLQYQTEESEGAESRLGRPVIIHRAIFGSLERFIAILTEHCGGKWPFWISPRQIMVVPISAKMADYAIEVKKEIFEAGFEVDVDLSDKTMQKKVREAQISQYNYILVVGEKEMQSKTVNIRTRDNVVHGEKTVEEAIKEFQHLRDTYQF